MRPLRPRAPRSADRERQKPKLEQGSGCGGQLEAVQTMAEWDPPQYANMEINGGPAAVLWALGEWRSSTASCGRLDSRLM